MKSFRRFAIGTAIVFAGSSPSLLQAVPVVRVVAGKVNLPRSNGGDDGVALQTRSKSASEVTMDTGVVRAGSNTSLRASGRDHVTLDQGLALVASKPKFFRPAVSVETAGHRMQVKGTAQIYHEPGKALRVVVIEGRMSIALQSLSRERVTLRAGQMLVINPVEPALPEPLDIDLDRLVSTAQLLASRQFEEIPTRELVVEASREQGDEKKGGGNAARESSAGGFRDSGDSVLYARSEELVHAELVGEIDDLDGDGEDDDFGDIDDLDDEEMDDDDLDDTDGDDGDGDGDEPEAGDGGGGGDE